MAIQYINDKRGNPQFVVLSIDEYNQLVNQSEDALYQPVPYVTDKNDSVTVPDEVVQIMIKEDISLQAAWRVFRGLSQYDVAKELGINQSAVSQLEKPNSKPQKKTREKLAKLYGCTPEQLIL